MAAPDELKMEPEITDKSVCVWVGVCACVRACRCACEYVCVVGFYGPHCVDTQKLRNQHEMHETKMDDY